MACANYEQLIAELEELQQELRMCGRKDWLEKGCTIQQIFELLTTNMHNFQSKDRGFLELHKQLGNDYKQEYIISNNEPNQIKLNLNYSVNIAVDDFITNYHTWLETGMNEVTDSDECREVNQLIQCIIQGIVNCIVQFIRNAGYICFITLEIGVVVFIMYELWLQFYVSFR